MTYKNGDRIRLKAKPGKTGRFIRYSRSAAYEVVVMWDDTHTAHFVPEWEIEEAKDGCG